MQRRVSEQNRILQAVRESEERYRRLVELSPDGISVLVEEKFFFMNPAGTRILGGSCPEEFLGKPLLDFIHCDYHAFVIERLRRMEELGESAPWLEIKMISLDGQEIDVEIASTPFLIEGKPAVQSIFRDIVERKLAKEHLEFLANFDALTGLPNRRLFFDRMGQSLLTAQRHKHPVALLYLDLDRFKDVNDSLGHAIGDLLLQETADRLTQSLRLSDSAARMGGDEFTVTLTKIVEPDDAAIVAKRIIENLSRPFLLEEHTVSIGVSVGISICPDDGFDADTLLKKADTAMYRAKGAGSNLCRFYSNP
jgi:diguanylate cyclase (GGDEF)-like protein/PAS domain S-box-containing protein